MPSGIFAQTVPMLCAGLRLIDPTLGPSQARLTGVVGFVSRDAHPAIHAAVTAALAEAELRVIPVDLELWDRAAAAGRALVDGEAWRLHGDRFGAHLAQLAPDVADRLRAGRKVDDKTISSARAVQTQWRAQVAEQLAQVEVLVLPTLSDFPPHLAVAERIYDIRNTLPINVAGLPALVVPIPARPYPASLQVIGQPHSEDLLLEVGARLATAVS